MKKQILLWSAALLTSLSVYAQKHQEMMDQLDTYTFEEIQVEAEKHFDSKGRGKGTGYKQYKRWEYTASRSLDDAGYVQTIQEEQKALHEFRKNHPGTKNTVGNWQELGPSDLTITSSWSSWLGRISAIAVDANNYNHMLVASPTGGVWKTTDKGSNWTPLFDDMPSMDIMSVAIDPQNSSKYFVGSSGQGMLISTDAGFSWVPATTNMPSSEINRILIHPTNSNIMFASSLFYGIYKSTDGGYNWTEVNGVGDNRHYDIEFKANDPSTVLVSGNKVWRSTDGGNNFSEVTGFSAGSGDAKMIGVSQHNANIVYVIEESGGAYGGLYKSINGGVSFSPLTINVINGSGTNLLGYEPDGSDDGGQAPRDMDISVSPQDINEVHVSGINSFVSLDGGLNWTPTTDWTHGNPYGFIHADVDITIYEGNTIYYGTDGGIFISDDKGSTFTDLTPGINVHQVYKIGVSQTAAGMVAVGSQDNGTLIHRTNNTWIGWLGADGMECFVDHSNANTLMGTSQFGTLYKSTNGGQTRFSPSQPGGGGGGNWVTPLEQDPVNANTYYCAKSSVWKTTDGGTNWTEITIPGSSGNIEELKVAPSNPQVIYVANGSDLFKTTNGGTSWTNVSPSSITTSSINYISIDPNDPNRVALAMNSGTYKVILTENGGTSWTDITNNLPSTTIYCVLLDGEATNGIYAGFNGSIFYSGDNGNTWEEFSNSLPNVRVYELEIQENSKKLYAGTYGRGVWVSDVYNIPNYDYDIGVSNLSGLDGASTICATSFSNLTVDIKNWGQQALSNVTILVYNDQTLLETINHSTNLTFGQSETVAIPELSLELGTANIRVTVAIPGQVDENLDNDEVSSGTINLIDGEGVRLSILTDNFPSETTWELSLDGNVIQSGGPYSSTQTIYNSDWCLAEDCYSFTIFDRPGDGLQWNGVQGDYSIIDVASGMTLVDMGPDANFGASKTDDFCIPVLGVNFTADETDISNCEEVVFTATVNSTSGVTYNWDFGTDAVILSGNGTSSVTVYYISVGNKTVSVSINGGEASEVKTDYITVTQDQNIVPRVSVEITDGSNPACIGNQIEYTASPTHGGDNASFVWSVNNIIQNTTNGLVFTHSPNNGDKIAVEMTSNHECAVSATATSGEIQMIMDVCTGTQESFMGAEVSIHPNPVVSEVIISIAETDSEKALTLYNMSGQVLFYQNMGTQAMSKKLDMSTFVNGTYFLQIKSEEVTLFKKIVKE